MNDPATMPLETGNTERIPMSSNDREVIYSHNHSVGEYTDSPVITRYHRGPYRPAARQFIFGSQSFSSWQDMHGTHTRSQNIDRTNTNRAKAKPIRLWDRGAYPSSTPPTTYYSNPSQLMTGNLDASGNQLVTSQELPLTARGY